MGKIIICGRVKNKFEINGQKISGCGINYLEKDFIVDLLNDQHKKVDYKIEDGIKIPKRDFEDEYIKYAKSKVKYNENDFEIKLSRKSHGEIVLIECKIQYEDDKSICDLELFNTVYDFKIKIKEWLSNYCKPIYWLYDDNNVLICAEGYKKIHNIENMFRQVLSIYMMENCGDIYLNNKLEGKYKQYVGFYKSRYKDFKEINAKFYNIDFSDLPQILEIKSVQAILNNEKSINKLIEEVSSTLEEIKDISYEYKKIEKLENQLKSKLKSLQENDSIFDSKLISILGTHFKDNWGILSKMRNMVMHNKPICKDLFNDIKAYCEDFSERFQKCFEYIENSFYCDEDGIYEALCDWRIEQEEQRIEQYEEEIERLRQEAGITFPLSEDYVIDSLREEDKFINELFVVLREIEKCAGFVEYIYSNVDEIEEYMNNLNLEEVIEFITLVNKAFDLKYSLDELEEYESSYDIFLELRDKILDGKDIEELYENIVSNSSLKEDFELNEESKFFDCDGNKYEVRFDGELCPQNGENDQILCSFYKNDECFIKAYIEVDYGDYKNPSEGDINSSQVNIVNEELSNIYDCMKDYIEGKFDITNNIVKYIDKIKNN